MAWVRSLVRSQYGPQADSLSPTPLSREPTVLDAHKFAVSFAGKNYKYNAYTHEKKPRKRFFECGRRKQTALLSAGRRKIPVYSDKDRGGSVDVQYSSICVPSSAACSSDASARTLF
jgi:hypothetical protein